jgi:chromosome segregation ATPase
MTATSPSTPRTTAALAARRRSTETKLDQVRAAIAALRREHTTITYPALARRAAVSRTFLYDNPDARALAEQAIARAGTDRARAGRERAAAQDECWRERALNAEDALAAAHHEVRSQRSRIGTLMGEIRDLEHQRPRGSTEHLQAENTTLKQRIHQLTQDNRILDERLHAARSNLRFQDRRIADLEASILESPN